MTASTYRRYTNNCIYLSIYLYRNREPGGRHSGNSEFYTSTAKLLCGTGKSIKFRQAFLLSSQSLPDTAIAEFSRTRYHDYVDGIIAAGQQLMRRRINVRIFRFRCMRLSLSLSVCLSVCLSVSFHVVYQLLL